MQRMMSWLLATPFWVYFVIAAGLGGFALTSGSGLVDLSATARLFGLPAGLTDVLPASLLNFLPSALLALAGVLRMVSAPGRQAKLRAPPVPDDSDDLPMAEPVVAQTDARPDFISAVSRHHEVPVKKGVGQAAHRGKRGEAGRPASNARKVIIGAVAAMILIGLAGVGLSRSAGSAPAAVAAFGKDYLPKEIYAQADVAAAKVVAAKGALVAGLEKVPFLQSPDVIAARDRAVLSVVALDRTVWRITGLPLVVFAALLALFLLVLRASLKPRKPKSFAAGRQDPFDRLLQRRRDEAAGGH